MKLIAKLHGGPLDVIGDVHGEIDSLRALLGRLGYDAGGVHPQGRRLVFVGDLVDRGSDSPAVLRLVARAVAAGGAQCVLGNHELNILRDEAKLDNAWWTAPETVVATNSTPIDDTERAQFISFIRGLPLALVREDLRVVHACWHAPSIAALSGPEVQHRDVLGAFRLYEDRIERQLVADGLADGKKTELQEHGTSLHDLSRRPKSMPITARADELRQMGNPLRVLTSGIEAPADSVFAAGGKWRMLKRVSWWEDYDDSVPVIFGHYWRRMGDRPPGFGGKHGPDLFAGVDAHHWMGRRQNAYCVDFSIGARSMYAGSGHRAPRLSLAALRVPEWEVVHHDGVRASLPQPGHI